MQNMESSLYELEAMFPGLSGQKYTYMFSVLMMFYQNYNARTALIFINITIISLFSFEDPWRIKLV